MILEPNEITEGFKNRGRKILGLTSGCFDLIHYYHLHYLRRCRAKCDLLIVGVDSDDLTKANKGEFPAVPEYHRVAMIEALKVVDAAFIMRSLKDLEIVSKNMDILFKNSPQIYGTKVIGIERAELVIVEDVEEVMHTTDLKRKIVKNHNGGSHATPDRGQPARRRNRRR